MTWHGLRTYCLCLSGATNAYLYLISRRTIQRINFRTITVTLNSKSLPAFSVLLLGLSPFTASADMYAGFIASYADTEYQINTQTNTANPYLVQAQLGYFINDYIALEGRYGTSVQRDGDLAVDSLVSGYIKGNVPVTERIAMYGLAGYSYTKVDVKNVSDAKQGSFSFGVGFHYALSSSNAITLEFSNNVNSDDINLSTFSIGFQHRFE